MKKFFCIEILILFIIPHIIINAQILSNKLEKVISLDEKEIYIDTTNIKQEKNILSVLMITYYKKPILINELHKEIIYAKTQVLFDTVYRKINVIGNLYYDKNLKIIGEPFKPIDIIRENNIYLVDTSRIFSALFEKCINYIKFRSNRYEHDKTGLYYNLKLNDYEMKNLDSSSNAISKTPSNKTETIINGENYDLNSERLVSKTIFTDGNKFCIQISSWKEQWKAEREVNKLKNMGHNAFIVKVNIPGKGIWYRVRIGYFSTFTEAENYERSLK